MDEGSDNSNKPPPSPVSAAREDSFCAASWNVNSVKTRLPQLLSYLEKRKPSVLMLQEIKTETEGFPEFELKSAGYYCVAKGQKSYNGVGVISRTPLELIRDTLPGVPDGDEQARFIDTYIPDADIRVISVYVPNGEPPANDPDSTHKLEYKTAWLDALTAYTHCLFEQDTPFIIGGDFNVIENDTDAYNPAAFKNTAFTVPAVRRRFRAFYYTGLTNALRLKAETAPLYSYWDYRAGAWQKNDGLLLDHLFLSPALADRLEKAGVDSYVRGNDKASDHAPVWCLLSSK